MQSRSALVSVLKNRSFRALWGGQIASQLAMNMLLFFLGLIVYQNTVSNTAVSAIFLSFGLPAVVFGMVAGVVVDHVNRKKMLMLCDLLRALLLVPLFFFSDTTAAIYIFVFFHAVISQFYVPSEAPLIPQLVRPDQLLAANSMFSFTYYTSMAMGFILAGPLLRFAGEGGGMVAIGALFLVAAASVSRIPVVSGTGRGIFAKLRTYSVSYVFRRMRDELAAGVSYAAALPPLRDALVLLTGTQIMLAILGVLGPGFADRVLGIDVSHASTLIIGPVVLGIVTGALFIGNAGVRFSKEHIIRTGIISAGIVLFIFSLPLPRAVYYLLFFLLGVANSFLDVPANSILQRESVGEMRGRVYGVLTAAIGGVGILPVVLGGFFADTLGVQRVLLMLGAIVVLYGILRMRYTSAGNHL